MIRCVAAVALALASCAPIASHRAAPRQPQLAELNHAFATVDRVTAEAIRTSGFLREFANLEVRTTTGTRDTWTGRYLYGRQTYVEFFAPSDFKINGLPAAVGTWGLALSGDRPGFNAAIADRLRAAGHEALLETDTRKFGERSVPWFEALTAISTHGDSGARDATASVWAMEYQPSYFELPDAGKEAAAGANDIISRERYQSDLYASKLMRDIVSLHFDIGTEALARIRPLLEAAGYHLAIVANGLVADGEETDFHFTITAPSDQGLRKVEFVLNRPAARRIERIGNSTLVVGPGATASWTFPSPRETDN